MNLLALAGYKQETDCQEAENRAQHLDVDPVPWMSVCHELHSSVLQTVFLGEVPYFVCQIAAPFGHKVSEQQIFGIRRVFGFGQSLQLGEQSVSMILVQAFHQWLRCSRSQKPSCGVET